MYIQNTKLAYLLGAYFGDGHIDYDNSAYQFIISAEDLDLCEICNNLCGELFDKTGTVSKVDNYYKLVICSKNICNEILSITSSNKDFNIANKLEKKSVLPEFDSESMREFIIGLMDSDGWVRETVNGKYLKYEFGFKNTNPLTLKIREMMQSIGLDCNAISETEYMTEEGPKISLSWTIKPKSYIENCTFKIARKLNLLNKYKNRKTHTTRKDSNIIIRLRSKDHELLQLKSQILGTKISQLVRDAAISYWTESNQISNKLLNQFVDGNEEQKQTVVNILVEYYHFAGFPHIDLTTNDLLKEMNKLCLKNTSSDCDDLKCINTGISMANFFHPHMMDASARGGISPMRAFTNDEKLADCIRRHLDRGQLPSKSGIRRILKTRDYVGAVYNFRPTISKFIYDNFCPKNGYVLDPCAGYGGRLAGCIASNKNISYFGIDPDSRSLAGNMKMAGFFKDQYDEVVHERFFKFKAKFELGCAEDILPLLPSSSFDLVFTSPPYFKTERYSEQLDQSYKRYPKYEQWYNCFLRPVIEHGIRILKPGGYFVWNTKNYNKHNIANDSLQIASECMTKLIKQYNMILPNREYTLKSGQSKHSEPIFVLQKQE